MTPEECRAEEIRLRSMAMPPIRLPFLMVTKGICGMTRRWIGLHVKVGPFFFEIQVPRRHPRNPSKFRLWAGTGRRTLFDTDRNVLTEDSTT